jgi:hypothetical protein
MDPSKYEYQSELAKPSSAIARVSSASAEELDEIGERVLTARTLEEALTGAQSA